MSNSDQHFTPRVITICPDYGGGWAWVDAENPDGEGHHLPIGDGDHWEGCKPLPVELVKRCGSWEREFAWAPITDTLHAELDWEDYHRRGRELALNIKRILGPEVRIIYQKPTEDPRHQQQERIEVDLDGHFVELPPLKKSPHV